MKPRLIIMEKSELESGQSAPGGVYFDILKNKVYLRERFGATFDLIIDEHKTDKNTVIFVSLDGMYNNLLAVTGVVSPVCECMKNAENPDELLKMITESAPGECDCRSEFELDKIVLSVIEGCMAVFIDGLATALIFSVQGYLKRGIDEPQSEVQEFGSREGFVEMFKDNVTLIRRRLKTPDLVFETTDIGSAGKTKVCICYDSKCVSLDVLDSVKAKLNKVEIDVLLGAGELKPFLDTGAPSFFSGVGITERPDVLASKLVEGRVGILVDGSPFALVVPHLFIENFHSLDDYFNRPYYASLIRVLKLICFFVASFLPGMFVAVGTFHQELFPADVLYDIVTSSSKTPFPILVEALVIHFIYEIVREAGLRVPKMVGHAVSIVGALVIGDAAVAAGLIDSPMLIIVAITAVSSAAIPSIYQPVAVLRFIFITVGGLLGMYGIFIVFGLISASLCSVNPYGVPYMSPVSPFDRRAQRDNIIFAGIKKVSGRRIKIQNLKGSDIRE